MKENKKKKGKKYTRRNSNDNNIYQIIDVVIKEGQQYFKFGPSLNENGSPILCLCNNLDKNFLEEPNL